MTDSILDHWKKVMPNFQPRDSQLKTFEWVESLPANKKYILLEMPVGGGKSPVGLTISSWLSNTHKGNSFILTPQKILQRQYEDSFEKDILASVYGKNNYHCQPKNCSCEVGSTIKPTCTSCPYNAAFKRAQLSPNIVLNYKLALMYFTFLDEDKLPDRTLMVMDECHNLENQLVEHGSFSISEHTCQKISNYMLDMYAPKNIKEAHGWIVNEYMPRLINYISELGEKILEIEKHGTSYYELSDSDQSMVKDHLVYTRHLDNIKDMVTYDAEECSNRYALIRDKKYFKVKELFGARIFNNVVKPKAEKFLFMSSTILNKEGFCDDLGISHDEAAFLSLDSEFDVDRRKVFFMPAARMSYGWDSNDPERVKGRENMANSIRVILNMHSDVSGIIHTGSYKLSKWVIEQLQTTTSHVILNHNTYGDKVVKRDDIINEYLQHAKEHPTVLVSPSITEGIDLKDELGRFAIFAKVPYPSLADEWVKKRMALSPDWYQRQTLKEIIQGSGRICRSHTDWGFTYILDGSFFSLYDKTHKDMIPDWWMSAYERVS